MSEAISLSPPPPIRLREHIRDMTVGDTLFFETTRNNLAAATSYVRCNEFPERKYRTKPEGEGARVWRMK